MSVRAPKKQTRVKRFKIRLPFHSRLDFDASTEYATSDLILSDLALPRPVEIRIVINEDDVLLYVGPRDWQWDRRTRKLIGAGTELIPRTDKQGRRVERKKLWKLWNPLAGTRNPRSANARKRKRATKAERSGNEK